MKKIIILALTMISLGAKAQLSQQELSQLNSTQKKIYLEQSQDIRQTYEHAIFQAEDMIKMGKEMKVDNASLSGSYYIAKGMELKETAEREYRAAQQRLDSAAREAIRNNQRANSK